MARRGGWIWALAFDGVAVTSALSKNDFFSTLKPTRTARTEAAYRKRAAVLVRKFETDKCEPFVLAAFVTWLVGREQKLADRTKRQYWASVLFTLRFAPGDLGRSAALTASEERLIEHLRNRPRPIEVDPQPLPKRTSAMKHKKVDAERFRRLVTHLRSSAYVHDCDTRLLLLAGLVSGLRPIEWQTATLQWDHDRGLWTLVVRNGKATNGRGHGDDRRLDWFEGDPSLRIVQAWLQRLDQILQPSFEQTVAWDVHYKRLRDALLRANRRLWPRARRRITFYTTRHMFGAHAKAILRRAEVAALMGHANDRTAGRHYAGAIRSKGLLPSLPQPSQRDVERIRRVAQPPPHARVETVTNATFKP